MSDDTKKANGSAGVEYSMDIDEPLAKRAYPAPPDITMISSDEDDDDHVDSGRGSAASAGGIPLMPPSEPISDSDDESSGRCSKTVSEPSSPSMTGANGEKQGFVSEFDPSKRVLRKGHFIRQEVAIMSDPWREETEAHAEIGPVKYVQEQAIAPGRESYELPLPDGWLEIQHRSGLPVYMHRASRVCTWSRPYYLGPHSARRHDVPLAAVPCLMQKYVTERPLGGLVNVPKISPPKECPMSKGGNEDEVCNGEKDSGKDALQEGVLPMSNMTEQYMQNVDENSVTAVPTIGPEHMLQYVRGLWSVKTVETHCFCRHCRAKLKSDETPSDPAAAGGGSTSGAGTAAAEPDDEMDTQINKPSSTRAASDLAMGEVQTDGSLFFRIGKKGGTTLHTAGKTPLSVLNEYCQRILRQRPEFVAVETDDPKNPFKVSVVLNGIQYGVGYGNSKKQARQGAAEMTLEAVNPLLARQIKTTKTRQIQDIEDAFEDMVIDDPGIPQLCIELGMPRPSQVLAECLRRNQGTQPMTCDLKVDILPNKTTHYIMKCGEHVVEGRCASKKLGRQTASQAMLKILHPHIYKWASIMRIYCDPTSSSISQRPFEEETSDLIEIQSRSKKGEPNMEVLNELKRRMLKLLPPKDSGRPLDPNKVRLLHDYKVAPAGHPSLAPVPQTHSRSQSSRSSSVQGSSSQSQRSSSSSSSKSYPSSRSSSSSSSSRDSSQSQSRSAYSSSRSSR